MITLNGFTNGFDGQPSSVAGKAPRLCQWVYGQHEFDGVTVFEDGHIWSGEVERVQSRYKVGWLHEPRHMHPKHYTEAERLMKSFDCILTHDQSLLDAYPNKFRHTIHGGILVPREAWGMHPKSKNVGMFDAVKDMTAGHKLRHKIASEVAGIDVHSGVYGDAKIELMKQYRFWVVVENSSEANWFTDHVLDAIALGCVPIYYYPDEGAKGQHEIEEYIDMRGLMLFGKQAELDDMLAFANEMGGSAYEQFAEGIRANLDRLPALEVTEDWFVQYSIADLLAAAAIPQKRRKVFISPTPAQHPREGGILRVVNAMRRHLPAFGWDVVDSPAEADVINTHGDTIVEGYEDKPVVQSNHGFMWSDYWGHGFDSVNAQLTRAIKRADAVTVPSRWVANALSRGIACNPVVIHHGVDADEWQAEPTQGYALWNKARGDEVSDPREVAKLAALMPDVPFVSTLGTPTANLKICGTTSYADMKRIVACAGVYLALPRETFGIGTIEAMACGVPVAGWDYGGQREIIRQGETGYLAPYGDYKRLSENVRLCLSERKRLSQSAMEDVRLRWGWSGRIQQYAELFDSLHGAGRAHLSGERPRVSVIVTSFNLARFLPDALQSVLDQTMQDWECIIVDDCSTDNTEMVAFQWAAKGRFQYVRPDHNLGLPAARNYGIAQASGQYIIPLDADDMLAPDALQILSDALDRDKSLHIAYGHLDVMGEDGQNRQRSGWGVHPFDYHGQLAHNNQLHYSAMMRRTIWERTQGYRRRSWQAEDAEFWGYATSFGFNAQRVTDKSTLIYRIRSGSKSSTNNKMDTQWPDGDWSAWYTWRDRPQNTPFGAQGKPKHKEGGDVPQFWLVPHHAEPEVSIIIPVGPAHRELVQDALDSVLAQTFTKWELVIVNDSGQPLDLRGYDFSTVVDTGGNCGAGVARNRGVGRASAPLLVFLDADDILQPTYLEACVTAYRAESKPALVYCDWFEEFGQGENKRVWKVRDWDWRLLKDGMLNCVTALLPKAAHIAIGGFDESLPGFEDYAYMLALAEYGLCGKHLAQPLMTYRKQTGTRNTAAMSQRNELYQHIMRPYLHYFQEGNMPSCSSCGGGKAILPPAQAAKNGVQPPSPAAAGMVLLEYMGESTTTLSYRGRASGQNYRFAATEDGKLRYVHAVDLPHLLPLTQQHNHQPVFRKANEPNQAPELAPLVVRDRVVPPAQPQAERPQIVMQPLQGPLPQVPLAERPRLGVQPVIPPGEANRVSAPREAGIPVTEIGPIEPMRSPIMDTHSKLVADLPPLVEPVVKARPSIPAMSYNAVRLALEGMTTEQKLAALAEEQAGAKPRKGVLTLIQSQIDAAKETVTA